MYFSIETKDYFFFLSPPLFNYCWCLLSFVVLISMTFLNTFYQSLPFFNFSTLLVLSSGNFFCLLSLCLWLSCPVSVILCFCVTLTSIFFPASFSRLAHWRGCPLLLMTGQKNKRLNIRGINFAIPVQPSLLLRQGKSLQHI